MTTGHRAAHAIDAGRERELAKLLDQPWFQTAVAAYKIEDDSHDIPFAGGSDDQGTTIFWDRRLSEYIKAGKFKIGGKSVDPRQGPGRVHEATEGAILRNWTRVSQLLGWKFAKPDYTTAHDIATIAEQHAAAHLGWPWGEYQDAWREVLPQIEDEKKVVNPPPNLIKLPYQGTKQAAEVAGGYRPAKARSNDERGDTKSMPIGLAKNPAGKPFQCGACEWFDAGKCWNKNPRLHGQQVDPQWCCNLYKNDEMEIVIR